jgi:hypothetical protein
MKIVIDAVRGRARAAMANLSIMATRAKLVNVLNHCNNNVAMKQIQCRVFLTEKSL